MHQAIIQMKKGKWKGDEHQAKKDAKSFYSRPYPILLKGLEAMKGEVYFQCNIGEVQELSPKGAKSHLWAFHGFRVPKKSGQNCLDIDFQKINLQFEQRKYPYH